jgi:hypothetical protein
MAVTGGQATSISLDKEKYGTDWMNDGVQGGSLVRLPPFQNTKYSFVSDIQTHIQFLQEIWP